MSKREILARVLAASRATDLAMAVRGRLRLPWVPILTFHHIADLDAAYPFDRGVVDATPAQLRAWTERLCQWGTPLTLGELGRVLDGSWRPRNPFMLTFDDGYASNAAVALPLFRALGVPATFFIASDFITSRTLFWWDRIAWCCRHARAAHFDIPLPPDGRLLRVERGNPAHQRKLLRVIKDTPNIDVTGFLTMVGQRAGVDWDATRERELANQLLMTWDDIRSLGRAGMDIGSHTRSHRVLATVPEAELDSELRGSRADIETEIGRAVTAIAYPVGHSLAATPHIRSAVARAGYQFGFTNASGLLRVGSGSRSDRFELTRLATEQTMSDASVFAQCAWPGWDRLFR